MFNKLPVTLLIIAVAVLGDQPANPQDSQLPPELQRRIDQAIREAGAQQRRSELERVLAELESADRLGDQAVLMATLRSLSPTAQEGVAIYTKLLEGPENLQLLAMMELGNYGPEAQSVTGRLLVLLEDNEKSARIRGQAGLALGKIKVVPERMLPVLTQFLRQSDLDFQTRKMAIETLGLLGPSADDTIPLLEQYLEGSNSDLQFEAYQAIGAIMRIHEPDLSELRSLPAWVRSSPDQGFSAFTAIEEMGDEGVAWVPGLIEVFEQDRRSYVRAMAIRSLGNLGAGGGAVARVMLESIASEDRLLSELGRAALAMSSTGDSSAIGVLIRALKHPEQRVRFRAAVALKGFGAAAKPAVANVVEALREADGGVDHHQLGAYLDVLRVVGAEASDAAPVLVDLLPAGSRIYENRRMLHNAHLRAYMLVTLTDIGVPLAAMPQIIENLRSGMPHPFAAAAQAAGRLGPEGRDAVPYLLAGLESDLFDRPITFDEGFGALFAIQGPYTSPHLESVRALADIGPAAIDAIPLLTRLAKLDHDPSSLTPPLNLEAQRASRAILGDSEKDKQ